VKHNHLNSVGEKGIDAFLRACEKPVVSLSQCALCKHRCDSMKKLRSHIGRHQQELSLFAVPSSIMADEDDSEAVDFPVLLDASSSDSERSPESTHDSGNDPPPEDSILNHIPASQGIDQIQQNPMAHQQSHYDPQFTLFIFEKPKGAESWQDVEAEQQRVNTQDLQEEVRRFQRAKNNVKRVMEEIASSSARRLINELVEEQNHELQTQNRKLSWFIASIETKWKPNPRKQRQLSRISVILQTGPSGH
jgi:hypothetical protein